MGNVLSEVAQNSRKIKGIIRKFLRNLQERRKKKGVYPKNKGVEKNRNIKNKIES